MRHRLWKFDRYLVSGLLLIILASVLGIATPLQLKKVIDSTDELAMNQLVFLLALFVVSAVLLSLGNYMVAKAGETQVATLRLKLIERIYHSHMTFFHQQKSGELASRIVNDTLAVRDFLIRSFPNFVASIVTLCGTVAILFYLDVMLSLCLFVGLLTMVAVVLPLSRIGEKSSYRLQEETSKLVGTLTENFQEIELIKINTSEDRVASKQARVVNRIKVYALKNDLMAALEEPFAMLFIFGIMFAIFLYGGRRVSQETLTIGTLISFMVYLLQLLNPLGSLSAIFTDYSKQKGATKTLLALLEEPIEQREGDPVLPYDTIRFEGVCFGYTAESTILRNIHLTLSKGKKVALVGPSGSGKTTLINLLARYYQPHEGTIWIGSQAVNQLNLTEWREQIALVSQGQSILSGSVRDNLCFGLSREVSDSELREALVKAYLWDDVVAMVDGLDSQVGERGRLLSGGQRQRLQIAHAYLKQSPVLIFDEATANLDADAEYQITQSLNALLKDRLTLIIAHRLSTVTDADQIYFMENNEITGQGTHAELLESHETYARFVAEQMI